MKIIPFSPLTFWRFLLTLTGLLSFLAAFEILESVAGMGIDLTASRSWAGLLVALCLLGAFSLLLLALTWSRYREQFLVFAEFPEHIPHASTWLGIMLVTLGITGFTVFFMLPFIQSHLDGLGWLRCLIFLFFSLIGMGGIKLLDKETPWLIALIAMALCQSTLHLLLVYWSRVTSYPFAMGWSETSRFYFPSLFLSEKVYGR